MALIQRTEELILNQLLYNEDYFRKVYPHLDRKYFHERIELVLFDIIKEYSDKYNIPPTVDTVSLLVNEREGITNDEISDINDYISALLVEPAKVDRLEFIVNQTEKFCQEKAMYNAIIDSMSIINGDDKKRTKNAIPDLMRDALRVSFQSSIGLDYNEAEERYDKLHELRNKIPFDIEALNIITKGGIEAKTLNCVLASTGVGKTIFMCHTAAAALSMGKNVLYITMEMSEEKIAQRIDANLMDVELDNFDSMKKETFLDKFKRVLSGKGFLARMFGAKKKPKLGRLFIKEFPTGAGNANHFRFLLDELKLKKGFVPDFVVIDYINICSSTRILPMAGSYTFVKAIAEELRGMAVEYEIPILTGTQTNRGGFSNSDIEMTDTSESIGLPQTLDLYIALMTNDQLAKAGRIAVKQLKNRYRDENKNRYFSLGLDKPKMRFFHVDDWNKGVSEEDKETLTTDTDDIFNVPTEERPDDTVKPPVEEVISTERRNDKNNDKLLVRDRLNNKRKKLVSTQGINI
jgi:replicative DNA helicase